MPVVSRSAKVRIADTPTGLNFREWAAVALVQDSPAGAGVDITVVQTTGGATPPGTAGVLTLSLYNDAGVLIRSFALAPAAASQTVSFHFTADGTATGAPRAGTVEIAIRATRSTVGTYDVESDGAPNDAGAGNTSSLDRGWIRGTTTSVSTISNVALGGAKDSPAQYDESLFVRTTLGAPLYLARPLTVAVSGAAPALAIVTDPSSAGPWDASFIAVVDDRFPAGVTVAATSVTVPNAALTGQPATVLVATNDVLDVDPRVAAVHHFQVDDNVFALAKHDPAKSMLSTESGFLATRLVTSRTASGVNALTVVQALAPERPGVVASASSATATRDGQAGWTELLAWTAAKPGGMWNKSVDVTAPAAVDLDALVLGGADAYVMRISDPAVVVLAGGGPTAKPAHFTAGQPFQVGLTVVNVITAHRQPVDADAGGPLAFVALLRLQDTGPNAGLAEYLDAALTWQPLPAGVVVDITYHRVPETQAGSGVYSRSWTAAQTAGWGDYDIFTIAKARVGGTDYGNYMQVPVLGGFNDHGTEDAVSPAEIAAIANAVWDEPTAEARATNSYGERVRTRLDVATSTRATPADVAVTVTPRNVAQADIF